MVVPQQGSKFDMRLNPVYRIDWFSQAKGKRISQTKRKVQFNFGFSNPEAIQSGQTGPDCRGEEHQVELVWSLTSGKRIVTFDGREVHFSKGKAFGDTKFDACWSMDGGHQLKLIAHAVPPLTDTPGFRQFNLILDGMSFFDMPHIYELGHKQPLAGFVKSPRFATPRKAIEYDDVSPSQDSLSTLPTVASYESSPATISQPKVEPVADLLDAAPIPQDDYLASPTHTLALENAPTYDQFDPVQVTPTFESVSNQILSAYTPTSAATVPQLTYEAPAYEQQPGYAPPVTYGAPTPQYAPQPAQQWQAPQEYATSPYQAAAPQPPSPPQVVKEQPLALSMAPLAIEDIDDRSNSPTSPMDKALNSLVNFDDIKETKKSPEQRKYQQIKEQNQPPKSKPLPPSKADWTLGLQPKLGEIKECAPVKAAPPREIMRTHAFDPRAAQAGMMVVYGSTPPPSQPSYYHGYQQQPMMYASGGAY